MPLSRYQIRNEYSLADPELYRAADKDDPEALLEGVAMAGLVGVLRQLGDLAEFAAEMFHDLHEEVMATAARGHDLMVRVQQLEAEFPSIEKAFLSQTSHSLFFYNTGVDWHPNIRMEQNLITQGGLPRFVMDSYEECQGPPRLFLLDKFDVAGAGACSKRYTDPSFFKVDSSSHGMMNADVQREKKTRKAKKKGSRWRNGETPEVLPTSHTKLHQLFLEERVESYINDPARHVKLKRRLNGFPFDSKTRKSYMENFLKSPTPDHNVVRGISDNSPPLELPSNITGESGIEILEISRLSPEKESLQRKRSPCSSPDVEETGRIPSMDELSQEVDYGMSEVPKTHSYSEADTVLSTLHKEIDEKEVMVDGGGKIEGSADGYQCDDIASEVENYMDALTTMDSEMQTYTECRAKNDMRFLNIKNHGMDSVANEEQQDLQARFSNSQSTGDSTAMADGKSSSRKGKSSLSYFDTLSNLVENTPPDGDVTAEILPSTKICEAEIVNMSPDRCLVNGESSLIQPLEHMVCNGVCIEEAEIPRYRPEFGEPSASSCLTDSSFMRLTVDPGTSLAEGASVGPELDEISSNHNEFNAGHIHPEENRTYMGDQLPCTSNLSYVSCQTRDDFLPELSSDNHPVDELDDEDLHILLHASLHLSNILEVAPAKESSEILLDDVLQAKYKEDECTKISVDCQIDSPHSVASHTKEKPLDSALPELETCDPHVEPDSIVSEVDDDAPLSEEKSINSTPLVDSPQASNFTKKQFSEITENASPLEPDSAEVAFSYSAEKNPYGASNSADGEKICGYSSDRNMVGKDAAELQFPPDFQNSPDPPPVPKVHVLLDVVVTETVHSQAVVMATAGAGTRCDDSEDVDNSLSTSPTKLQEESISSLQVLHQNGLEIDEACSPGHLQEFGTEKEVDQQAVASSDLDFVMCNAVPYDDSKLELLNNVPDSSMVAISRNSLHIVDAITVPLSSDQNDQDSESKSPKQINVIENTEDAISSPSHHIAELRTLMAQKVEFQADQYDVESLHAGKESSKPFLQVERIQSPDHLDQEQHTNSSSEFCAAHLPSQPSVAEFLPQVDMSEQATDPSSSILPFGLLPEASQINLDGMPPLPPLPPVQWRIGKVQHASLAPERDLVQHNLDPFPQILASTADKKAQSGHLAIEGEITQPSNTFFLFSAVKEETSQHGYENLACCMVHSTPLSLQVPTMVSHGNIEDNVPSSGRTHSMNPFLALPIIFNAKSQNGFLASEGGTAQPNSNPFSPVTNVVDTVSTYPPRSLQETLIQPLHQSAPKISSEDEKLRGTSIISKGKVVNPPETTFPPPVMQDDQPQRVFSTSKGETAWLSSASVPLAPFEIGKPNGNRQVKLPRPRNPLIDAVVAHDKSKLRKVTEWIRPQIGQEVDERGSFLEQIRAKSFNLKPAVMTRPSIQGPKTNLKVVAILEKANAIRQALAGSDEDDDADGWSDS